MKKIIFFLCVITLFLSGCKVKFNDPKCELIDTVEKYNQLVKDGAKTEFKNYKFIDLRSRTQYQIEYISNFHYKNNVEYKNLDDLEKIIQIIEKDNKAKYDLPVILIDSGDEGDNASDEVYALLIEKGYKNVKNVVVGFIGLKNGYQIGFPYNVKDGSDCGCE